MFLLSLKEITSMKSLRSSLWLGIAVFVLPALLTFAGFAQSRQTNKAQILGPEDPSAQMTVTVWLKQHNKAVFDELVRGMYEPGSSNYHHWLTREQYYARFAPTAADAAQVREYLAAHNFTVTSVEKHNHYLVAQGRVSDVQNAFNVQINRMNANGTIHRVSSGEWSIAGPVGALVKSVQGLHDFAPQPTLARPINPDTGKPFPMQPFSTSAALASVSSNQCLHGLESHTFNTNGANPTATYHGDRYASDATNTCPGYIPAQLQSAYRLNSLYGSGWDGTGQTIIIVDAYGSSTIQSDANVFSSTYGLPQLTSANFQIYYPNGPPTTTNTGWAVETSLDVEWAHSVAPGANIALVIADNANDLDIAEFWAIENPDIVTNYANGDLGYVISNSWAGFEYLDLFFGGKSALLTEYDMTQLGAALGISTNFASGDWGDNIAEIFAITGGAVTAPPSVCTPASAPYATGIGGTSVFLNSTNAIQLQTGWGTNITRLTDAKPNPPYDPPLNLGFLFGAGGGQSMAWPRPPYQSGMGGGGRLVPDISYVADPYTGVNVIITINGTTELTVVGGTSLATPMFSGLWAITNQAAGSKAPLGQAAPYLYSLPAGAIRDVQPRSVVNVSGQIVNPPSPVLVETAADLAQPLENTTTFMGLLYHGSSTRWYDLTFGTDTSLVVGKGWDNVTGLGTPEGPAFVGAVVAAAPAGK
jgi:subtilase family serine protease